MAETSTVPEHAEIIGQLGQHRRARPPAETRQVFSVPEAARVLGISRTLAYELVSCGDLPSLSASMLRTRLAWSLALVGRQEPSLCSSQARRTSLDLRGADRDHHGPGRDDEQN
jgi:predicted DNA-binding transcriptional regulator AlpA